MSLSNGQARFSFSFQVEYDPMRDKDFHIVFNNIFCYLILINVLCARDIFKINETLQNSFK